MIRHIADVPGHSLNVSTGSAMRQRTGDVISRLAWSDEPSGPQREPLNSSAAEHSGGTALVK